MALYFSSNILVIEAVQLYPTPTQSETCGRILIVRATIHDRDTLIVGFHADNGSDSDMASSILTLQSAIQDAMHAANTPPGIDIILMGDHNHKIDLPLDYLHVQPLSAATTPTPTHLAAPTGLPAPGPHPPPPTSVGAPAARPGQSAPALTHPDADTPSRSRGLRPTTAPTWPVRHLSNPPP